MKIYKNGTDLETQNAIRILGEQRGFITIATGCEKYHKMAQILMYSYKLSSENPCRFGVITDNESRYTDTFDDVIVVKDATRSYMDKIELLVNSPYKETIFIDADCIAFGDLNQYWNCFETSSDMSAFGRIMPLDAEDGWFKTENIGKFKNRISYCHDFHGGIYYFRKGSVADKIHEDCLDIIEDYPNYKFKGFSKPADEPVFALAMAANACKPTKSEPWNFAWFRRSGRIRADFFSHKLTYNVDGTSVEKGLLLHFGTSHTILPIYLIESKKVLFMQNKGKKWNKLQYLLNVTEGYLVGLVLCVKHAWKILNKRKRI